MSFRDGLRLFCLKVKEGMRLKGIVMSNQIIPRAIAPRLPSFRKSLRNIRFLKDWCIINRYIVGN